MRGWFFLFIFFICIEENELLHIKLNQPGKVKHLFKKKIQYFSTEVRKKLHHTSRFLFDSLASSFCFWTVFHLTFDLLCTAGRWFIYAQRSTHYVFKKCFIDSFKIGRNKHKSSFVCITFIAKSPPIKQFSVCKCLLLKMFPTKG